MDKADAEKVILSYGLKQARLIEIASELTKLRNEELTISEELGKQRSYVLEASRILKVKP